MTFGKAVTVIILSALGALLVLDYFVCQDFRKGVPIETKNVWNADSTHYFTITVYSLGVFGGSYTLIEPENAEQFLRFGERGFIRAVWSGREKITVEAYEKPSKQELENVGLDIQLVLRGRHDSSLDTLRLTK